MAKRRRCNADMIVQCDRDYDHPGDCGIDVYPRPREKRLERLLREMARTFEVGCRTQPCIHTDCPQQHRLLRAVEREIGEVKRGEA